MTELTISCSIYFGIRTLELKETQMKHPDILAEYTACHPYRLLNLKSTIQKE